MSNSLATVDAIPKRVTREDWLSQAFEDADKDGPATMVTLVHRVPGGDEEVHTIHLTKIKRSAKQCAALLNAKAVAYAQDMVGMQTFAILVFYNGKDEPEARHPFMLAGRHEHGGATEPATGSGPMQQQMRHSEAFTALVLRQVDSNARNAEGLIDRLSDMNQILMKDQLETKALMIELMTQFAQAKADRSLEIIKAERDAEFKRKLWELAPAVANSLLGSEVIPQSTADTALMKRIAAVFDPTDPAGSLQKDPMLVALLMGRLTDIKKAENEAMAERERAYEIAGKVRAEIGIGDDKAAE